MPLSRKFQRAQGAAGARSALKSPGGGRRPPPGDFRLPGPGPLALGRQTPPPPLGRAGVPHGREPRLPPPGRISQPAESVFQEGPPAGNSAFRPCSRAFGQQPLGRVRRAAGLGLPCLGWRRGGAAAFGGPGAEGPRACQTKRAGPGARSFRALRALPPPPRRHPRQGSSRFPPAEAGAKAAGFRQ